MSDEALYQAYLRHQDQNALRTLLERHRDGLTLFLYGFVRNAQDAEELMLDAFAEVAAGPTLFSGKSSFKTWLFSVGKHLALAWLRKQKRAEQPPPDEAGDEALPELLLLRQEQTQQLYRALERIAADYREALTLHYMEEMSPAEISQVTGTRIKQIYNRIERGKKALRAELERMGFEYAEY